MMTKWKMLLAGICVAAGLGLGCGTTTQAAELPAFGFVQAQEGVMWRNADGTWLKDSWLEWGGLKYHLNQDGYIQVGFTQVDGKTYYLYPNGTMAVSWVQIGDGIYYFYADGVMAADTVVEGFQVGKDGRLIVPEALAIPESAPVPAPETTVSPLKQQVDAIIAAVTTPEMSSEQKLAACYAYIMNASKYKRSYETPSGDWTGAYASEILTTGKGNCYRYAAGFAYLAKGLGFETRVATGSIKAARGGVTPHGWTEVKIGGTWYIFDSEMQDAKGYDLYKKTYKNYPIKPLKKTADWAVAF